MYLTLCLVKKIKLVSTYLASTSHYFTRARCWSWKTYISFRE